MYIYIKNVEFKCYVKVTLMNLSLGTMCSYPLLIYIIEDTTRRWTFSPFSFKRK